MNIETIRRSLKELGLGQVGRWFLLSVLIGIVAAAAAMVFDSVQTGVQTRFLEGWANFHPPSPHHSQSEDSAAITGRAHPESQSGRPFPLFLILVPALGGLVSGILVFLFAPEAEGHGTDSVIRSYHREGGRIRWQVPVIKLFASAITIGSGGSAGREGPIAQIGAGFGSLLSSMLKLGERERRTLLLAGVAAGVGAMSRAPLGGALFAAEVLYRQPEFEFESLIPCFIASILAYSVYCVFSGSGFNVIFSIPEGMQFADPRELLLYAIVGIVLAVIGSFYVTTFEFFRLRVFGPLPVPRFLKPMLGGVLVGLLATIFAPILGVSYGYLDDPLNADIPASGIEAWDAIKFFLALGFLKILATSLTIGSGGSGGVFAPSLVIGGSFGAVFGILFSYWFPWLVSKPGAFVLVGMGGFFSGVAKVPITSLIMVCEMTSGYGLVVPLMLVTAITYVLTTQSCTIYPEQVSRRVDSPAHAGEFMIDVLEKVFVKDIMLPVSEVPFINEQTPLGEVLKKSTETHHQAFPVLNEAGEATGVVSLEDVRSYYYESELGNLIIAGDLNRPIERIVPSDDLNTALQRLVRAEFDEYPVVDEENSKRVVGLISRRDLLSAYHRKFREMKKTA